MVAHRAMPLAQSWGEPPPRDTTKSHSLRCSSSRPLSTLAMLGLALAPSNTTESMSCIASFSAIRLATPASARPVSVTIRALRNP
ncbi:hypothetical protein D3C80_1798490 [compost metagenome]